jgi:hypothetical protein
MTIQAGQEGSRIPRSLLAQLLHLGLSPSHCTAVSLEIYLHCIPSPISGRHATFNLRCLQCIQASIVRSPTFVRFAGCEDRRAVFMLIGVSLLSEVVERD